MKSFPLFFPLRIEKSMNKRGGNRPIKTEKCGNNGHLKTVRKKSHKFKSCIVHHRKPRFL